MLMTGSIAYSQEVNVKVENKSSTEAIIQQINWLKIHRNTNLGRVRRMNRLIPKSKGRKLAKHKARLLESEAKIKNLTKEIDKYEQLLWKENQ